MIGYIPLPQTRFVIHQTSLFFYPGRNMLLFSGQQKYDYFNPGLCFKNILDINGPFSILNEKIDFHLFLHEHLVHDCAKTKQCLVSNIGFEIRDISPICFSHSQSHVSIIQRQGKGTFYSLSDQSEKPNKLTSTFPVSNS